MLEKVVYNPGLNKFAIKRTFIPGLLCNSTDLENPFALTFVHSKYLWHELGFFNTREEAEKHLEWYKETKANINSFI